MRSDHETLWYLLDKLTDIADTYHSLKDNELEKSTNTRLGRWALKYNFWFLIFFGGATALGIWAGAMFKESHTLYGILLVVAALGIGITSLVFGILAFASEVNQMRLNNKPIGVISLLITLAIIIGSVVAIIISITIF